MKLFYDNKGITLIELLVAIAIMSMVLAIGYNMYYYGTKSFTGGTTQAHLQQNARLVDEYFKKELRNVGDIKIDEIYDNWEVDYDGYYKVSDKKLIKATAENIIFLTDSTIKEIVVMVLHDDIRLLDKSLNNENDLVLYYTFRVLDSIRTGERPLLIYEIISGDGDQEYIFKNQILLNNINYKSFLDDDE